MERIVGFEPAQPPWQGGVLPLYYTRICAARELRYSCLCRTPRQLSLVMNVGIEPTYAPNTQALYRAINGQINA